MNRTTTKENMPLWQRVIRKQVQESARASDYILAKHYRNLKVTVRRLLKDFVLIVLGILSATFGLKGFLFTNHFIDGGVTGISLLISFVAKVPLYLLIILLNIPFILLAFKIIGKQFAIKTVFSIAGLAASVAFISFPDVTQDNLLVAVFGGFFLGAGIGLVIRGGAVIDGTEVLAIYLSRKLGTTIGDIIILINAVIFLTAAYFLSIEIALYSIITYLAASKTLDFLIEGIDEYIAVTIVSVRSDEMREMIVKVMGRGVTVFSGKRGFGKRGETKEVDILYTVITRLEMNKLNTEIEKIEPGAFVVMHRVKDTKGGMIKKKPLK